MVLKKVVANNKFLSIGGNLQLALAHPNNCNIYSICKTMKKHAPQATIKYRNLDVFDDIGVSAGACYISIYAMYPDW